jgi:hypothetical protein
VDFKAVGACFHEKKIVMGEFFFRPIQKLFEAHVGVG